MHPKGFQCNNTSLNELDKLKAEFYLEEFKMCNANIKEYEKMRHGINQTALTGGSILIAYLAVGFQNGFLLTGGAALLTVILILSAFAIVVYAILKKTDMEETDRLQQLRMCECLIELSKLTGFDLTPCRRGLVVGASLNGREAEEVLKFDPERLEKEVKRVMDHYFFKMYKINIEAGSIDY